MDRSAHLDSSFLLSTHRQKYESEEAEYIALRPLHHCEGKGKVEKLHMENRDPMVSSRVKELLRAIFITGIIALSGISMILLTFLFCCVWNAWIIFPIAGFLFIALLFTIIIAKIEEHIVQRNPCLKFTDYHYCSDKTGFRVHAVPMNNVCMGEQKDRLIAMECALRKALNIFHHKTIDKDHFYVQVDSHDEQFCVRVSPLHNIAIKENVKLLKMKATLSGALSTIQALKDDLQ